MSNAKGRKNFTACGVKEAEELLEKVISEMKETLSGSPLCVYLGGSYGRGDGGVRQDRENGILYNDLDFFVFARKKSSGDTALLNSIRHKYEELLKVDVDFSRIMTVRDIKNNSRRLMMQELKRGYRLICGEDLIGSFLPEFPAESLPCSEACRLLLNRGMGLLLAGEKIANAPDETDFILRNICKAVLGAGDAVLIAEKKYQWTLMERLEKINSSDLPEEFKKLYAVAVEFKKSPNRDIPQNLEELWLNVCSLFRRCTTIVCGEDCSMLYSSCEKSGEVSFVNYIKYCIKSRSIPVGSCRQYMLPAVAVLLPELYGALSSKPENISLNSRLYRQWLIFN